MRGRDADRHLARTPTVDGEGVGQEARNGILRVTGGVEGFGGWMRRTSTVCPRFLRRSSLGMIIKPRPAIIGTLALAGKRPIVIGRVEAF